MSVEKPNIEDLLINSNNKEDCIACCEISLTVSKCCKAPICSKCYLKWLESKRQCMHCKADQCSFEQWVAHFRVDSNEEENYNNLLDSFIEEYLNNILQRIGITNENAVLEEFLNAITNAINYNTNNASDSNSNNASESNTNNADDSNTNLILDFYLTSIPLNNNINNVNTNELIQELYNELNSTQDDVAISSILRNTLLEFLRSSNNNNND
jgi:hypothetical protein